MESHQSITVLRLRAVPLRSVKSKLGRTGESELPMIFTRVFFRPSLRLYLFIYLFIYYFIILPHAMNYKQNKNDNK